MSVLRREIIESIGESLGLEVRKGHIDGAVYDPSSSFVLEVEYRLRRIVEQGIKFMKHAKRTQLTVNDINAALSSFKIEACYGYNQSPSSLPSTSSSSMPPAGDEKHKNNSGSTSHGGVGGSSQSSGSGNATIRSASGRGEKMFVRTHNIYVEKPQVIDVVDLLNVSMPQCPLEASFNVHWLAIEGVQPKIPQNEVLENDHSNRKIPTALFDASHAEGGTSADAPDGFKPLVKHVVPKEMQSYYTKIIDYVMHQVEFQHVAFQSLATDPGLHQLLPYFSKYIYDQVQGNSTNLFALTSLMRMTRCLLDNPHLHVELYLHQLLPAILTCILGKALSQNPFENHWALRDYGALLVARICQKFGETYENLQARISRTYFQAYSDASRPLTTHYGAIVGILHLGPLSLESLVLPTLPAYLEKIQACMIFSNHNQIQRMEAQHCYGAIVHATGRYMQARCQGEDKKSSAPQAIVDLLYETLGESLAPYLQHSETLHAFMPSFV